MSEMRHTLAVALLLVGCLGAETETESCQWQERLTHANAPADECARYTAEPGFEEHTRFRAEGDPSCDAAVSCVIVRPGERATILGTAETEHQVHATVEYGACDSLPPCL